MNNSEVLLVVKSWLNPSTPGASKLSQIQKACAASEAMRLLSLATHPERGTLLGASEYVQLEVFLGTHE